MGFSILGAKRIEHAIAIDRIRTRLQLNYQIRFRLNAKQQGHSKQLYLEKVRMLSFNFKLVGLFC